MQTPYSLLQDTVIDTQGLAKRYGAVSALQSLDLQVPTHSIFGFLGPNGAGKSTAFKLLLGLVKPTRGEGRILGYDIVGDSLAIRPSSTLPFGHMNSSARFAEGTQRAVLHEPDNLRCPSSQAGALTGIGNSA